MRFRKVGITAWSVALFIAGTSCNVADLESNEEYEIELTSVDQFGAGASTTIIQSTQAIEAEQVDGLSNWATELDPVDLAFIQANMDNDAIPSEQIASLVASKITAGQIDVAVDIGTGVQLDGANGTVKTTNNDYTAIMGNADGSWNQLPNPTVLTNLNTSTNTQTFGVDTDGNTIIGNGDDSVLFNQTTNTIDFGSNVTIGSNVDQTINVSSSTELDEALVSLSKIVPAYKNGGFTATISISNGTVLTDQIHIDGVDLSFITIDSSSDISVDPTSFVNIEGYKSFITISSGGIAPLINANFKSIAVSGSEIGLHATGGSSQVSVTTQGGFDYFDINVFANNSGIVNGKGGSFRFARSIGAQALSGGILNINQSGLNSSKLAIYTVDSTVQFNDGTANFSDSMFVAIGSTLNARNALFTNWEDSSGLDSVAISQASKVEIFNADFTTTTNINNRFVIDAVSSDVIVDQGDFEFGTGGRGVVYCTGGDIHLTSGKWFSLIINDGVIARVNNSTNSLYSETPNTLDPNGIIFN